MSSLTDGDRVRYERNWANYSVRSSSADHRELWHAMEYSSRIHVYADKVLIAWRLSPDSDDEPEILNTFHLTGVDLSFEAGLQLVLRDRDDDVHLVTSKPTKVRNLDLFLWTPAFSETRWTPREWNKAHSPRVLRVGLNFRQHRNLSGGPVEDTHYLSEVTGFRAQFPHLADLRF